MSQQPLPTSERLHITLAMEASPSRKQSHRRTTDDTEARVCVMNVSHVTM